MTSRVGGAVSVLATDIDVRALADWIEGIPLTDWPAGSLTEIRPAMVTDPQWHGFGERIDSIVTRLLSVMSARTATCRWLSVVMPGHSIPTHRDAAQPGWIRRVHVPLTTNDRAVMIVEDEPHHLMVGTAYLFDKTARHAIVNDGSTPRIHLMFDALDR